MLRNGSPQPSAQLAPDNICNNNDVSNHITSSDSHPQISMTDLKTSTDLKVEVFEALPQPVDFSGVTPSTRYQVRGLARRALSYHRRQRFSSIFCLVLWPILLVLISFAISSSGNNTGLIRYCTNEVNPQLDRAFDLNYGGFKPEENGVYNSPVYPSAFGGEGYVNMPCVRWFAQSYPTKQPYENNTHPEQPDTVYVPAPDFGWYNLSSASHAYMKDFPAYLQGFGAINQSTYISADNADILKVLGPGLNIRRVFISDVWPPVDANGTAYAIVNNSVPVNLQEGLLAAIPIRYDYGSLYVKVNATAPDGETYWTYKTVNQFTATPLYLPVENENAVQQEVQDWVAWYGNQSYIPDQTLPFGGVSVHDLDPFQAKIRMTMQYGVYDKGQRYSSNAPVGSGIRQIITMTQMTQAITRLKYGNNFTISQGIRALPYEFSWSRMNGQSLSKDSMFMFPFALSFLLPTFVSILVQEKEDRHRMMMSMNGLKSGSYYLAHYAEFMTMQLILTMFFSLTNVAIKSLFITRTNPGVTIMLFLIWAHVQTTFAFALASFFSKTRKATLVVYFFVSLSAIMSSAASLIFDNGIPFAWFIHPSFNFFNILNQGIVQSSLLSGNYPMSIIDFASGTLMFRCLLMLLGESIFFILVALYVDAVVPSEYGVHRPWHFPITGWFKSSSKATVRDPESSLARSRLKASSDEDTESLDGGDADVHEERNKVSTRYDPEITPLIINNLYHRYPGKVEAALRGMSFGVEANTVLGLLGPNGAGKSTLIHLLTGLYEPTSGTASVAGANIRTDMHLVHSRMGVCPQHDILWGDLTVADHLLFYARLRGIPPALEQQAVTYAIASVSMSKFRDRQVKGLSGGEKRRVSIAIALLGDNRVIFLDEPSTGLDPAIRRVIWDIINRVKINRTVILTTHSMEEADILSDRIAIMTAGRLRCIGTSLHLKDLYGSGFRLNITSKPGRLDEACQSVEEKLMKPAGTRYRRTDKFTNASVFDFDVGSPSMLDPSAISNEKQARGQLSTLFHYMSQPDIFPAIEDWGVSQTTLEDVFVKIVTDADTSLVVPPIVQADQV
ncbi:ABC-2 type transport system ATP-binding protein [Entomortierella parvispora]|uniref:ABC-2 type transport system ATP-binding protein n=1 Tax=Entomortierella parvispora TaxID=205924 RepID=A0A9P3H0A5_9FUNG|nr:ABC-2 type transport system ATP-binding protein [Entomortierella parvispora]